MARKLYFYNGPVYEFDRLLMDHWRITSWANSEAKARSNMAFTFKRLHNRTANANIKLPGKIEEVGV